MKIRHILGILPIIAVAALDSCSSQPGVKLENVSSREAQSIGNLIFNDVNAYRRAHGSRDLQRHAGLERLAMEHCEYLRRNRGTFDLYGKNVSHDGAEGRSLAAMRTMKMLNSGENIASIMRSPTDAQTSRSVVKMWQNSKNHEYGMRSDSWTHTGVGVLVDADGRVFVTQLFGTLSLSHMDTRERFIRF
jgi:uncharacterized protein YkwD